MDIVQTWIILITTLFTVLQICLNQFSLVRMIFSVTLHFGKKNNKRDYHVVRTGSELELKGSGNPEIADSDDTAI